MHPTDPAALLAPYRTHLTDPRHALLTEQLLAWYLRTCTCDQDPSRHASTVFAAATFDFHCAPRDAALQQNLIASRYLVLFLAVDDSTAEEKAVLAGQLTAGRAPTPGGCGTALLPLLGALREQGLATERLLAEITGLATAMAREAHVTPASETLDQLLALRHTTIGTLPYITLWRTLLGLAVPAPGAPVEPVVDDAIEATYLANDLASLARDGDADPADSPATSNSVLVRAMFSVRSAHAADDRGELPPEAVAGALDTTVARYATVARRVEAAEGDLGQLLRGIVEGNLEATSHLVDARYPGANALIPRLHRMDRTARADRASTDRPRGSTGRGGVRECG
ncbi:terpene synthase family protein [Streptomyces sp. IBSNAI002]|uniref:terpene synthase family protein n=1 Tax=Streptomyces sp. IBSNAI002 TaxID=3457500 RepID=UPI003FD3A026